MNTFFISEDTTITVRKEHYIMSNSKDTSSKKQGKSSSSDNNISNKSVTHTDHRSKTTSNKAPSSGNIRGV